MTSRWRIVWRALHGRDPRPSRRSTYLVAGYEARFGVKVEEQWPEANLFFMHHEPFRRGLIHAENVGGDLASVLNRRLLVGAFPWKFVGGEASICRIVAFEN